MITNGESNGRLLPHAPEVEQSALGCVMLGGLEALAALQEEAKDDGRIFYEVKHKRIYAAMLRLSESNVSIDPVTLYQDLSDRKKAGECGGLEYIAALPDSVPSADNLSYYLGILREKYVARLMIQVATKAAMIGYDYVGPINDALAEFEEQAMSIRSETEKSRGLADIPAVLSNLVDDYESAKTDGKPSGILTGFTEIDEALGGMMGQEMIVIAGLRSSGKTSLALNIALKVAIQDRIGVGFFSLETSSKKLLHRICAINAGVDGAAMLRGRPEKDDDVDKLVKTQITLTSLRHLLLISDSADMSPSALLARGRQMYQKGARVFFLDYLQLIDAPGQSEYERTSNASKFVKRFAKEFDVPVVVIASMNREAGKERKKPRLEQLRSSGQIDYDCDKALLLWVKEEKDEDSRVRPVQVECAKSKDGPKPSVTLTFKASQFRFENAEEEKE